MSRKVLNCGYVPLVDCAPLILAKELGFAEDEGLRLNLLRQPSWSALRDLLAWGHLDAAHMLSPMPLAMRLGLSGPKMEIDAPLVLSANGTVTGVSAELAKAMRAAGWVPDCADPHGFATMLFKVTGGRFRVGVPFPYSMHRLLFEYLIKDHRSPDRGALEIVTMPPPLMADAVANGDIDVFCVGEPWGSVAVSSGFAELAIPGSAIWAHAPEKVLGMRRVWFQENEAAGGALMRAIYRASTWAEQIDNRHLAGEILACSEHLDLSDRLIDPALSGRIEPGIGAAPWRTEGFVKFHGGATTFPWRSHGAWMGQQIAALQGSDPADAVRLGADLMRPDLYRRHLAPLHVDMPGNSVKIEGAMPKPVAVASTRGQMTLGPDAFFDGKTFEFPGIS